MLGLVIALTVMGTPVGGGAPLPVPAEKVDSYFDCLAGASPSAARRYVVAETGSAAAERALQKLDSAITRCMQPIGLQAVKGDSPDWYRHGLAAALQRRAPAAPTT